MSACFFREGFAAIAARINAIVPASLVGLVRPSGDRFQILYWRPAALGMNVVDAADVPEWLRTFEGAPRQIIVEDLGRNINRPVEAHLLFLRKRRVVSLPMSSPAGAVLWAALDADEPLSPGQLDALASLACESGFRSEDDEPLQSRVDRLKRCDDASALLGEITRVLDIRDVFDRLAAVAKTVLPHDALRMGVFGDNPGHITFYAAEGLGFEMPPAERNPYPIVLAKVWDYLIIDDLALDPVERNQPAVRHGYKSCVRLPVRLDGRLIAALDFISREEMRYTWADMMVGRRIASLLALAISHHRLAEERHQAARLAEQLRVRTTTLELLDELLVTVADTGDLPDVFGRISTIARKVLTHDAAALMVRLPDGVHARAHASAGFPVGLPEINRIPEELLRNPEWEYDILDDLTRLPAPQYVRLVGMGFHSLVRVPLRLDGVFAGALVFLSRTPSAFKHEDILPARRMADRLALAVTREREAEASKRAAEADARASKLEARVRMLTEELDARTGYRRVVGESRQWRQVLTQATQVAATETTVLLLGESGTGKEVVARFLHRGSARSNGPFIGLNCAALPEQLLEAELFGYERGAYTGATQSKPGQLEQAGGGTLFLDEVAEMSPSAQAKFLRVLQEREFQRLGGTRVLRTDARVVAATNRDLERAIANNQFREDLYYRLNVFAIRLPPLRERRDDILPLSEVFLLEIGRGLGRPPAGISRDARQTLVGYHWPGNVRELRNILERAAILCDGGLITAQHLALNTPAAPIPHVRRREMSALPRPSTAADAGPSGGNLSEMERAMIEQALQTARFNKSRAALALGLTRHQLYTRLRKHGLD
jgi:transcriptional regulator with GAF, ATPase, and Fis domain